MIEYRFATHADVPQLHRLIEGAYRGESAMRGWTHEAYLLGGQRTDTATLNAIIADPLSRIIITDIEGVVAGCVHIKDCGDHIAYLGMLAVDPSLQEQRLGTELILAAEQEAVTLFTSHQIEMTVIGKRTELIEYYQRRGYQLTGESRPFPYGNTSFGIPTSQDLDFVVLEKTFPRS